MGWYSPWFSTSPDKAYLPDHGRKHYVTLLPTDETYTRCLLFASPENIAMMQNNVLI